MSQNDLTIANQGFASFRSDLNSALQALGSTNSGTSAPSTTFANQLFYDTTNNILKIRNEDNDAFISLFTLDQANDNIESLTINGAFTCAGFTSTGIDDNADALAITIDSSENVMVGTTNSLAGIGNTDQGISLRTSTGNASSIAVSRASGISGYFNRNDDGDILAFLRSGTAVGAIKALDDGGGEMQIAVTAGTGSGVYFTSDTKILPVKSGSLSDNTVDIGKSNFRFKDLYLSSGVFLGGTGSANELHDYEEGSFTPTFGGSSGNPTVSYSVQLGTYVKVGNIVTVTASVIASGTPSGGAGDLQVKGLPFTGKTGIQQAGSVAFTNNLGTASGTTQMGCNIEGGVSYLNVNSHEYSGQSSMSRTEAPAIQNSAPRIVCTICYETS